MIPRQEAEDTVNDYWTGKCEFRCPFFFMSNPQAINSAIAAAHTLKKEAESKGTCHIHNARVFLNAGCIYQRGNVIAAIQNLPNLWILDKWAAENAKVK